MGVSRQIGEHGLRPAERPLGIDHPLDVAQRRQICLESFGVIKVGVAAEKLQAAGLMGGAELARNNPWNRRERTFTDRRKFGLHETYRDPSAVIRPPRTIMWTWGWWVIAEPQV